MMLVVINSAKQRVLLFLCGGLLYCIIEILWRGYTHWTMGITGGVCMVFLFEIMTKIKLPLYLQCLVGSLVITFFEFSVGTLVNLHLHWNVWDYSDMPLNLYGQICVPFMIVWYLLCVPASFISRFLEKHLFSKSLLTFRSRSYLMLE